MKDIKDFWPVGFFVFVKGKYVLSTPWADCLAINKNKWKEQAAKGEGSRDKVHWQVVKSYWEVGEVKILLFRCVWCITLCKLNYNETHRYS